ncbi:MAG: hypothetical protein JXR51_07450, partial [Bacteroidales bacterium]|nr:hypothetical protein [Bacteroidales bacterium]MBN2756998.1 hypothetical protein [Bacteroidales bacterium]
MLEYYPYTVTPFEVETINNEGIPIPQLPNLPSFPKKPRKKFIGAIILVLSITLFVLLNIYRIAHPIFIYLLFFIAIISLTATIFEMVQNSRLMKTYLISVKLHKEQEEEIKAIKERRQQILENNKSPEAINAYRQDTVKKYFNFCYDKIRAVRNDYSPAKQRFLIFLEEHFLNKTMDNVQIVHESKNLDYMPDFILKFSRPKLNIAIEIEEPYTLKEIEGNTDITSEQKYSEINKVRTRIANELRWLVIVFSEEQIVSHPTECCKFIAEFVEVTLLEDRAIGDFSNVTSLSELKFNKERDVNKLMKTKYRESYLSKYGLIDGFTELEKKEALKTAIIQKSDTKEIIEEQIEDKKVVINTNGKVKKAEVEEIKSYQQNKEIKDDKIVTKREFEQIDEKIDKEIDETESEQLQLIKKVKAQLDKERKLTYKEEIQQEIDKKERERKLIELAAKRLQAEKDATERISKKESISKLIESKDKVLKREALILNDLHKALQKDEFGELELTEKELIEETSENSNSEKSDIKIELRNILKDREKPEIINNDEKERQLAAEKAQLEKELAEKEAKEKERQLAEEKRK